MKSPKVYKNYEESKEENKKYTKMVLEIIGLLYDFFEGNESKIIDWLETNNGNFGYTKPIDLIKSGRANKVLLFCKNQKEENKPPRGKLH